MVYIILGTGFEESEAVIPCDLLRRSGVQVQFAGIGGTAVKGSHGIVIEADCAAEDVDLTAADMLVLPGGLRGVKTIRSTPYVLSSVKALHEKGGWVAAICAAPTILGDLGILQGRKAVCYPGMEEGLTGAVVTQAPAVRDGNVITGRSAGAAFQFGLSLVEALCGPEAAKKVAAGVVFP